MTAVLMVVGTLALSRKDISPAIVGAIARLML